MTKKILKDARDILAKNNWIQGMEWGIINGAIGFCAVGAIKEAGRRNDIYAMPAINVLSDTIWYHEEDSNTGSIPLWNDHPGRTKEEVLAMFDRAIERAEN